jgi:hypothetical protein
MKSNSNAKWSLSVLMREMHTPFRRRSGGPAHLHQLESLLRTGTVPLGMSSDWQPVADVLRAAIAPARPSELTGEAAILAAFRRAQLDVPSRRPVTRPPMLSALLTGKLAALAVCATVGVGGAATAAYANALPAPIQGFAHSAIGAPAPHPEAPHDAVISPEPSHSAKPEPTRSAPQSLVPKPEPTRTESPKPTSTIAGTAAAYALCRAYAEATAHGVQLVGSLQEKLVALAGGAANIAAFCATVPKPTPNPSEHHDASTNPVASAELCKAYNRGVKLTGSSLELLVRLAGGTDHVRAFCSAYPTPSPAPTSATHTGDPTSAVAIGLCNGYRHGTLPEKYLAMLDQLAGGADHVAAFCATVPQPTEPAHAEPSHSPTPTSSEHPIQEPPSSPVI